MRWRSVFDAKVAIHPIAGGGHSRRLFTPTPDQVEWGATRAGGGPRDERGVFQHEGTMVDAPVLAAR